MRLIISEVISLLGTVPHLLADTVERLGDGVRGRGRLLSSVERHDLCHKRRGRAPIHSASCTDHTAQRPRHKEPLRDSV